MGIPLRSVQYTQMIDQSVRKESLIVSELLTGYFFLKYRNDQCDRLYPFDSKSNVGTWNGWKKA